MMTPETFRTEAHRLVDWMADFLENIEEYPVKPATKPGDIIKQLPTSPPLQGESFDSLFKDFQSIIMPGITHWQHPHFHAYFPANGSYPSILAEMLTTTLGAQCMIWETSPAAAELEEMVMNWLKEMMALPAPWHGVIQDTASTATLVALLTAREKQSGLRVNDEGFNGTEKYRVYCSSETHSSIEKGAKVAGIGKKNVVKVSVDDLLAMRPDQLEEAIKRDIQAGYTPLAVVAAIGTTSTVAVDPLKAIGAVCRKYNVWLHVDAAYAGTALLLPECRWMMEGQELADSFVFNPHKWMFTHFDCTAYFVKDKEALIRTFEILPEYLKTATRGQVNDYRDWGVQLGRRFRALKLWFVIRSFGIDGLQKTLRGHMSCAEDFEAKVVSHSDFELVLPRSLNVVVFRFKPASETNLEKLNQLNEQLIKTLNASGKVFISHTKVKGIYCIRMVLGNTRLAQRHVDEVWAWITDTAKSL
ncbi:MULTISPECIES: pyridoxal-dependent decarboxylase [unclassified Imperialibacter]|uniref:pyridoxal phosphate-dependent decarboxylase family protein n=1 Tax=unclassified Imperialibacter TaxID=2629706 RepID=UPI001256C44B|nr:Aromatic-L-amino-acid decarboxylase [Imperialibacter sp. 89]CAD5284654.1 Aromatic-L-amino-acid decarboxylase [Imperialibacter sp. 75]VVT11344.1 Aromatic-L-amino-acid decarboxylase [Imperialibacter sp. EC-SDR9]